jgi:hypothetical protein
VRFRLRDQIPPQLHARGFAIAAGVLGDDALTRWKVSTRSNSPVDEAEQRVLLFSPFTPAKTRETPR